MKTINNNFFNALSKNELNNLTKEVKETVAINAPENKTSFSAADLWNIQKTRRTVRTGRRLFV